MVWTRSFSGVWRAARCTALLVRPYSAWPGPPRRMLTPPSALCRGSRRSRLCRSTRRMWIRRTAGPARARSARWTRSPGRSNATSPRRQHSIGLRRADSGPRRDGQPVHQGPAARQQRRVQPRRFLPRQRHGRRLGRHDGRCGLLALAAATSSRARTYRIHDGAGNVTLRLTNIDGGGKVLEFTRGGWTRATPPAPASAAGPAPTRSTTGAVASPRTTSATISTGRTAGWAPAGTQSPARPRSSATPPAATALQVHLHRPLRWRHRPGGRSRCESRLDRPRLLRARPEPRRREQPVREGPASGGNRGATFTHVGIYDR